MVNGERLRLFHLPALSGYHWIFQLCASQVINKIKLFIAIPYNSLLCESPGVQEKIENSWLLICSLKKLYSSISAKYYYLCRSLKVAATHL